MDNNADLKDFLRTRRARLTPRAAGIGDALPGRRVPGLRREEIAALAGVSVDYYVRLEQGRNLNPSTTVLAAIARALQLDDTERAHLFDLAKARRGRVAVPRPQRVRPGMHQMLETLDDAASPAFVLGRRMDLLAANRMARALICDFNLLPAAQRNKVRFMFLDPRARELYVQWDKVAAETVAVLRVEAGRHPGDPRLAALVEELSMRSEEFRRWWSDHQVLVRTSGTKLYRHPVVGELTVDFQALQLPEDPDQTLFVYTARSGSPSHQALRLLASWDAAPLVAPEGRRS
ncbi:transcriptional regulator [Actinoplanes philippinensis]|uniref:Helix-turn-helix domain-containing protein n=1 Tax=Actinoplanes philippinensis TaxID=35752 RepID=A0A1I2N8K9_9ACTN|nr:helix-turn-helix transcriptional regulator [Actinoplanes philippinensis]GIE83496.1 transcriptional regulator [Actinoplanes philippinensis]SFF99903.1 Helix-turn-helix domain-containing protein [Actinoplanes philippinensis]